jgi:four helix bundle protein
LRSGTSIGANIEEAQAGQSKADFVSKMTIALKEARETSYWLRLIRESPVADKVSIDPPVDEASELASILGVIVARSKQKRSS